MSEQIFRRAYNLNDDELDQDPVFFDLEIIDLFPHDHPYMDEEVALMDLPAREMEKKLNEVIQNELTKETPVMEKIHAYMFVYDSSNKRTFESMKCMLETIVELEKQKKKEGGGKGGGSKKDKKGAATYFPKKIVVGNKKDLRKNKEAGNITSEDVKMLSEDNIKIKEISALTNAGI